MSDDLISEETFLNELLSKDVKKTPPKCWRLSKELTQGISMFSKQKQAMSPGKNLPSFSMSSKVSLPEIDVASPTDLETLKKLTAIVGNIEATLKANAGMKETELLEALLRTEIEQKVRQEMREEYTQLLNGAYEHAYQTIQDAQQKVDDLHAKVSKIFEDTDQRVEHLQEYIVDKISEYIDLAKSEILENNMSGAEVFERVVNQKCRTLDDDWKPSLQTQINQLPSLDMSDEMNALSKKQIESLSKMP